MSPRFFFSTILFYFPDCVYPRLTNYDSEPAMRVYLYRGWTRVVRLVQDARSYSTQHAVSVSGLRPVVWHLHGQ
jgi:hypothetical protein